jgi:hypothetical protein
MASVDSPGLFSLSCEHQQLQVQQLQVRQDQQLQPKDQLLLTSASAWSVNRNKQFQNPHNKIFKPRQRWMWQLSDLLSAHVPELQVNERYINHQIVLLMT